MAAVAGQRAHTKTDERIVFAVDDPQDENRFLWVVRRDDESVTARRWQGVPHDAVPIPSLQYAQPPVPNTVPEHIRRGLARAGADYTIVSLPKTARTPNLDTLGPGEAFQQPGSDEERVAQNDPFESMLRLVRSEKLPPWRSLQPNSWRLPSTSNKFWLTAEFPRDNAEFRRQLQWVAERADHWMQRSGLQSGGTREAAAITFLRERMLDLSIANVYRMAEMQGVRNRDDSDNPFDLPDHAREKIGRIPQEYRPPSPERTALSMQWRREWPNFIADDTTVGFLNEALHVLEQLSAEDRVSFLSMRVYQGLEDDQGKETPIDKREQRSMAECIGRAWKFVRDQQLIPGDGLIYTERDGNDCWKVWHDSVKSMAFADGTMPDVPVATIELQARTYDMLSGFAEVLNGDGINQLRQHMSAEDLATRADTMRDRIRTKFTMSSNGLPWLATGVTKEDPARKLQVRGVNTGLVLNTRLGDEMAFNMKAGIVRNLVAIAGPYGIPTMETDVKPAQYGGYHNGNTWAWVNADIVRGLARQGFLQTARVLSERALGDLHVSLEEIGSDGKRNSDVGTYWNHAVITDHEGAAGRVTVGAHPQDPFEETDQAWTVGARLVHEINRFALQFEQSRALDPDEASRTEALDGEMALELSQRIAETRIRFGVDPLRDSLEAKRTTYLSTMDPAINFGLETPMV